jgi:hypothetical protein
MLSWHIGCNLFPDIANGLRAQCLNFTNRLSRNGREYRSMSEEKVSGPFNANLREYRSNRYLTPFLHLFTDRPATKRASCSGQLPQLCAAVRRRPSLSIRWMHHCRRLFGAEVFATLNPEFAPNDVNPLVDNNFPLRIVSVPTTGEMSGD